MRNFILTVLFAVLCTAGLAVSAQDVPAQLGAAADQAQAAAAEAVNAVEAAMPAKLAELIASGAVRDAELSDTDECFDWYKDSDGAMYLVYKKARLPRKYADFERKTPKLLQDFLWPVSKRPARSFTPETCLFSD